MLWNANTIGTVIRPFLHSAVGVVLYCHVRKVHTRRSTYLRVETPEEKEVKSDTPLVAMEDVVIKDCHSSFRLLANELWTRS